MAELKIQKGVPAYQGNAVDLGRWQAPIIRTRTEDGDTVLERIPSAGHCKMVSPAGHVVRVQLFNGMGKPDGNNPYYLQISREKLQAGFVPYGSCPKSLGITESIPKDLRKGEPCKLSADKSNVVDNNHPCKCVVGTIEHRQGLSQKVMQRFEKRYTSKENEQAIQLSKAVNALTAKAEAKTGE